MDSPGHSAQYCTYTFMENSTHKILHIVVMDKRMTGGKSAVLEKACFQKGMQFLLGKGLTISEVVTDAHVQVEALMSKMIHFMFHYLKCSFCSLIHIICVCNFCTLLQRENIQISNILLIFGMAVKIWERKLLRYLVIKSILVLCEMKLVCLTVNIIIFFYEIGWSGENKAPLTTMDKRNC